MMFLTNLIGIKQGKNGDLPLISNLSLRQILVSVNNHSCIGDACDNTGSTR